ncbi:MAG: class I SAM-dependent methyltransferase [Deltaproteobacteria bacterium]|nr:class I SAM-dependent methyltransferase [Deltaproteobacteria bacterium]
MSDDTLDMQTLHSLCRLHGFDLPSAVIKMLLAYLELLLKWNKTMNLVGPGSWQKILVELLLDSFHLAIFLNSLGLPPQPECWDFGAGAGLPGLPLRMVWPQGNYTMVEAREKRALFLQNALATCGLASASNRVYRGRVENFLADNCMADKKADLLLSRAFMPWPKLLELAEGKLAPQGLVVCLTLEESPQEVPAPWELIVSYCYSPFVQEAAPLPIVKKRYFWACRQRL